MKSVIWRGIAGLAITALLGYTIGAIAPPPLRIKITVAVICLFSLAATMRLRLLAGGDVCYDIGIVAKQRW